tara:strand:+ start:1446 stop:2180 length:735 start_codon:yes stop_codon:yes gene_type:complete
MKKYLISILLLSTNLFANESLFKKANNEYEKGNYEIAIQTYEQLINLDKISSELYYNLGNSYYKIENLAEAIWCYEKSLKIKNDKKAVENLNIVKSKIKNRINPLPDTIYQKWGKKIINFFEVKTWQIITIIFIWMTVSSILISNFKIIELRKYVFYILACVSILLVFISYKSYNNFIKKEAIIFTSSLPVNSEPTDNIKNKKLFNLSLGTKVEVVKTNNDWIYIKLNDGRKGWIRENDVKRLN